MNAPAISNIKRTRGSLRGEIEAVVEHIAMLRGAVEGIQEAANGVTFYWYDAALDMIARELSKISDDADQVKESIEADVNWQEAP